VTFQGRSHNLQRVKINLAALYIGVLGYFSTLSQKRQDKKKKKVVEHEICVLIFSTTFV
jgi:hypothetical protein